jgi:hypothetical protein
MINLRPWKQLLVAKPVGYISKNCPKIEEPKQLSNLYFIELNTFPIVEFSLTSRTYVEFILIISYASDSLINRLC